MKDRATSRSIRMYVYVFGSVYIKKKNLSSFNYEGLSPCGGTVYVNRTHLYP